MRLPEASPSPLTLQHVAVNTLPCFALPDGIARLAIASSQGVQALPANASCPAAGQVAPPCNIDWCCVEAGARNDTRSNNTRSSNVSVSTTQPPSTAPPSPRMPTPTTTPTIAPTQAGTSIAIPLAAASAVVVVLCIGIFVARCAPKAILRRRARSQPPPAPMVLQGPRLPPIATRLLGSSTRLVRLQARVQQQHVLCGSSVAPLPPRQPMAPPCAAPPPQPHRCNRRHPRRRPRRPCGAAPPPRQSRVPPPPRLQTSMSQQRSCLSSDLAAGGLAPCLKVSVH